MKQVLGYLLLASSLLLCATPAQATKLESWKFNANQNQFEFTTDEGVQPQAQLVSEPTRLVIDLPGVVLGRSAIQESASGAIQSIRIGQFDRDTTRLVIELAPGYTLDPNQIKFRGISARQWIVKLPVPQAVSGAVVLPATSNPAVAGFPSPTSMVNGGNPPSSLSRLRLASATTNQTATIESVQLDGGGGQLVIRGNQPLQYANRWDTTLKAYRIDISPAQLANSVNRSPTGNAIAQLKIRQENAQTVSILVQPAKGVQVGQVSQPNQRMLTLQLQRSWVQPTAIAQSPPSTPAAPAQLPNPAPLSTPRVPTGRLLVVIDPGHGGPDPGAVGIGGLKETDIVLDIGRQVTAFLQQQGVSVLITRNGEYDLDLEPRVQMAEQARATVFVSIHANSIDLSRSDVSGLETYYYQSGKELAQTIHQSILQATGIPDRGVRTARFYVVRKTSMPSVLVEVGFVTGQDDAARLSSSSYRTQMAGAIARGILQYLQKTARF